MSKGTVSISIEKFFASYIRHGSGMETRYPVAMSVNRGRMGIKFSG